jgi:5-methylcytosine-specific restriction endonuclease McrA
MRIYSIAADGKSVRCYLCGDMIPNGERHVDHIVPLSRGGGHVASNLAIACAECNLRKAAKLPEEIGLLV